MRAISRRKSMIFFVAFGACLVVCAVALNVSWVLLSWRQIALLIFGIIFFIAIIIGLVLNTIFLVREIRRNEQQDNFLSAVTHELKTPLASIRLYLETLQTRELDDAQRRDFYRIMHDDSDRLMQTVEQVLRAGSISELRFRRRLHTSIVDLGEIARECLTMARTRYHLRDDALCYAEQLDGADDEKMTVSNSRPLVKGNPDELRAAISNLIDNAVKYSDKEVRVTVEVATLDCKRIAVRVHDEGIGIPNEQLKRIFKRFYRVPLPVILRVKGTGLGLFIVRTIAEKHGGRATAESAGLGGGSTFTIQLPRAKNGLESRVESLESKTSE